MSIQSVTVTADIAARRRASVMAALVVLVVLLALVSLGIGPVRLSPLTVIDALFGGGSDVQQVIVREIRLPRTILGFAIGAILGLSGAALQGLLRNPLASPSLFGAPQSAAFGAVLVIAFGLADVRSYALPVAAIMAAFASVFVLLAVAGRNAGLLILILAGLAISSLAGAATALVMNLSSNPFVVLEISVLAARLAGGSQFPPCHAGAAVHRCGRDHSVEPAQRLSRAQPRRGDGAKPWRRCRPAAALGDPRHRARRRRRGRRRRHDRLHWPGRAAFDAPADRSRSGAVAGSERAHRRGICCWRPISRCGSFPRPAISRSGC